jgi:hypothetical protein
MRVITAALAWTVLLPAFALPVQSRETPTTTIQLPIEAIQTEGYTGTSHETGTMQLEQLEAQERRSATPATTSETN